MSLWRNTDGAYGRLAIYMGFGVLLGTTFYQLQMTLVGVCSPSP